MDNFLYRLVGSIGTLATVVFTIDFDHKSLWVNALLLLAALYAAGFFTVDAYRAYISQPQSFNRLSKEGKAEIAEHLVNKIESSNSVAILSKDLTWVQSGSPAENLLIKKAQANELTLFVEDDTPLTKTLVSQGACVHVYESQKKKGFSPQSRFTILDRRTSPRVMVGIQCGDKHLIKEYGNDDLEVVKLATDFISLLESTAKLGKAK